MKRMLALLFIVASMLNPGRLLSDESAKIWNETPQQKQERMAWWEHDRFGMFIHWGLYAMPARHEWVKRYEKMTNEDYQKYFDLFEPDLYGPVKWAKTARAAGMKYAVITTKHHEGFCLFETKYTDYQSKNAPLCRRDLIREWVDAFRAEGLKIGFYYSLLDWHHPDFEIDRIHPQAPESKSESDYGKLNKGKDMNRYREYVKNQITELLTNYGKIDLLWLDYSYPEGAHGKGRADWDSEELMKLVRTLQPGIIVNDRAEKRLADIGEWMKYNSPSIYGCTEAPEEFAPVDNALLTYNPDTKRLYVHLLDYPLSRLTLKGYGGKVKYAQFLHDRSELKFGDTQFSVTYQESKSSDDVILVLPEVKPDIEIPVIELILE